VYENDQEINALEKSSSSIPRNDLSNNRISGGLEEEKHPEEVKLNNEWRDGGSQPMVI
jgi:hypothetical protein